MVQQEIVVQVVTTERVVQQVIQVVQGNDGNSGTSGSVVIVETMV